MLFRSQNSTKGSSPRLCPGRGNFYLQIIDPCAFYSNPKRRPLKDTTLKTSNITAASIALGIVALIFVAVAVAGGYLERRYVHVLAPILFPQKNQGIALQRIAFSQSDLLPLVPTDRRLGQIDRGGNCSSSRIQCGYEIRWSRKGSRDVCGG